MTVIELIKELQSMLEKGLIKPDDQVGSFQEPHQYQQYAKLEYVYEIRDPGYVGLSFKPLDFHANTSND